MIEEDRRLLYVAMNRARNELHLCAPQKYVSTKPTKSGDPNVHGGKSQFYDRQSARMLRTHDVSQHARRR